MASHASTYRATTRIGKWMDARLPVARMMHGQFVDFPTPRNINYLWTTGGILTTALSSPGTGISRTEIPCRKFSCPRGAAVQEALGRRMTNDPITPPKLSSLQLDQRARRA